MADEQKITETVAAVSAETVTVPTAEKPVVTPESNNAPAAADTAITPAAPVAEAPAEKETNKTEEVKVVELTTLGSEPSKEIKPEDATKEVAEGTKDESKQSDEPAPLPTYEPFKLPEGFTLDETKLGEFNRELAEFEVKNKAEHAEVQAFGQKMIERYTAELQRMQDANLANWNALKSNWKEAFHNDSELGGNRRETTVNAVQRAVEAYAGTPENVKAFRNFANETGLGENLTFIRLVHNMDKALKTKDEAIKAYKTKYESEDGITPLAATKPEADKPLKPYEKMYGKSSNNL